MDIDRINRKIFEELGKEKRLHEYHDIIYKLMGVVVDFINAQGESLKLSKMRNFNPFCAMMRSSKSGSAACRSCDQSNAHTAALRHKEIVYSCHAGLTEIILPLYDSKNNYIGGLTAGQFFIEGEKKCAGSFVRKLAASHKLPVEKMCRAYYGSLTVSKVQLEGLIDYLNAVGRIIVETHNKLVFLEAVDAPDKISIVKQFVADNYMKPLRLDESARKVFLSPGHFSRFFKQEVGMSFITYVNMYRIAQAEEMLRNTKRNISEIAFLTGFGSISQFNRVFRSVRGIAARDFRCSR